MVAVKANLALYADRLWGWADPPLHSFVVDAQRMNDFFSFYNFEGLDSFKGGTFKVS